MLSYVNHNEQSILARAHGLVIRNFAKNKKPEKFVLIISFKIIYELN